MTSCVVPETRRIPPPTRSVGRAAAVHDALDPVGAGEPVGEVERLAVVGHARERVAHGLGVVGVHEAVVGS